LEENKRELALCTGFGGRVFGDGGGRIFSKNLNPSCFGEIGHLYVCDC